MSGTASDPPPAGVTAAVDVTAPVDVTPTGTALCDHISALRSASSSPVLVALDGRSGAGKSTLAHEVGLRSGALVIDGDDFYRGGDGDSWAALGPAEKVELVID